MFVGKEKKYDAIVMGSSAGGLFVLSSLFQQLPAGYPIPVIVVQHRSKDQRELLEEVLQNKCKIKIKQADEKEKIESGVVYIAPPDYHLLIEADKTFSLSADEPVRFSRPSIDVLFESASIVFKERLVAIILTGTNNDGSKGIETVRNFGGLTVAQDPGDAQYPYMPKSAIETKKITHTWTLSEIQRFLLQFID